VGRKKRGKKGVVKIKTTRREVCYEKKERGVDNVGVVKRRKHKNTEKKGNKKIRKLKTAKELTNPLKFRKRSTQINFSMVGVAVRSSIGGNDKKGKMNNQSS